MADGRKYEKFLTFFAKMLEQHISFNFLRSKVSDLAKIYETNLLSLIGKKTKKGANFIELLYRVLFPLMI